jgi:hypothetical protein
MADAGRGGRGRGGFGRGRGGDRGRGRGRGRRGGRKDEEKEWCVLGQLLERLELIMFIQGLPSPNSVVL